ncbi:MAG: histidine kinase dimerization/phosphoacceptor domain -containing protein [Pseudomonadota bacterium]
MRSFSFRGLRIRLIALMTIALFPLGLISLVQTASVLDRARDINKDTLLDLTVAAASEHRAVMQEAIGAAAGLGTMALITDTDTCRDGMRAFLSKNDQFVFAGFIAADGVMRCSSTGDVVDFSETGDFEEALNRRDVMVAVNRNGAVTGLSVLIVSAPVVDQDELLGFVSLSVPLSTFDDTSSATSPERDLRFLAVNLQGNVLNSSAPEEESALDLPQDMPIDAILARAGTTFVGVNGSGENRLFAVTETIANSYVVIGSWPQAAMLTNGSLIQAVAPLLFPVLMWFAGLAVAYFGVQRLVVRHLSQLRSAMRRFALGERDSDGLSLDEPPKEFGEVERAFNRMTMLLTEAEARQMTDLHDKEVLLREVHHRVKNNLQLIASIMNLQSRSARTDEARRVLENLQRRVRGLAMLHRSLYSAPETSLVDASDLISAVVRDASAVLPSPDLQVETDLVSVQLYPDQAVPLSMWTAEALTNAVKYVGRTPGDKPRIGVRMDVSDEQVLTLEISNTVGEPLVKHEAEDSSGLGSKLMTAFTRQLEGKAEVVEGDAEYRHILRFSVAGFNADDVDLPEEASADAAA